MKINEQNNYSEKFMKYEKEGVLSRKEVDLSIQKIKDTIEEYISACPKEKKKLQKVLDIGEETIIKNFKKKYSIRYFYNKAENELQVIDILEYAKDRTPLPIKYDIIVSVYSLLILVLYNFLDKIDYLNWLIISLIFVLYILLISLTYFFYKKVKNDRYKVIGKDWLDQFILDLDRSGKKERFRIPRLFLFLILFIQYILLFSIDSGIDILDFLNSIVLLYLILVASHNLFIILNLNVYYAFSLIIFTIVISGLNFNNWAGVVLMLAVLNLMFSDEIWKLNKKFENPLKGKYNSEFNENLVERNMFKYRFTLSIMSLLLYIILNYIKDNVYFGSFLLGENFKSLTEQKDISYLNQFSLLLLKGLDRWIIIFLILLFYSMLVYGKNKLASKGDQFEEPIIEKLVQSSYKGRKIGTPVVKTEIEIDQDLQEIFEPKILIENIDELPKDIIVSMKTPVVQGSNVLFIQYADGEVLLKENVTISFKKN